MKETTTMKKESIPFTQVSNDCINNPELSGRSKGVYAYLYSKPDGWNFSAARICKDFKEGIKAIQSAVRELEQFGYIMRTKLKSGKNLYRLYQKPNTNHLKPKKAESQNGRKPNVQEAKNGSISNKESHDNITKVIKKDSNIAAKTKVLTGIQKFYEKDSFEYLESQKFLEARMDKPGVAYQLNKTGEYKLIQIWAGEFEKLQRIDGYDQEVISAVMRFANDSNFWKQNMLSPTKLRDKMKDTKLPYFVFIGGQYKASREESQEPKKSRIL